MIQYNKKLILMDMVKRIDGHILVFKCLELYGHRTHTKTKEDVNIVHWSSSVTYLGSWFSRFELIVQ